MFVCDQVVMYFDVERTLGMRSYQIWNKVGTMQSSPKPLLALLINLIYPKRPMFVCDQVVMYFDVERTLGMRSYQIWNKVGTMQSSPKPAIYDKS